MGSTNEQKREHEARLLKALQADPEHSRHGTVHGYRSGCRCTGSGSCTEVHAKAARGRTVRPTR